MRAPTRRSKVPGREHKAAPETEIAHEPPVPVESVRSPLCHASRAAGARASEAFGAQDGHPPTWTRSRESESSPLLQYPAQESTERALSRSPLRGRAPVASRGARATEPRPCVEARRLTLRGGSGVDSLPWSHLRSRPRRSESSCRRGSVVGQTVLGESPPGTPHPRTPSGAGGRVVEEAPGRGRARHGPVSASPRGGSRWAASRSLGPPSALGGRGLARVCRRTGRACPTQGVASRHRSLADPELVVAGLGREPQGAEQVGPALGPPGDPPAIGPDFGGVPRRPRNVDPVHAGNRARLPDLDEVAPAADHVRDVGDRGSPSFEP